uniref:Alpha-mannosidase n=1 Tax=Plectus sambesii TaxID=2011161 RepID=A0A914W7N2_9BILA
MTMTAPSTDNTNHRSMVSNNRFRTSRHSSGRDADGGRGRTVESLAGASSGVTRPPPTLSVGITACETPDIVNKSDANKQKETTDDVTKVFVLLHSHVDPGWLRTFDQYYEEKVKAILTKAVYYLSQEPSLRFIWSEISFLEKWWQNATEHQKASLLKVIKSGQLEITGGAWVMTDEATPYYWASIDNMIEGHQFVVDQLGVRPKTSWSVDPFGHGAMMPYLSHLAGIQKIAIGRVDNDLKAQLREKKLLVFRWRQMWDQEDVTDIWVHMLPRQFYTTSNGCGPDNNVCCQFEFGESSRSNCLTRQDITPDNVGALAEVLTDSYRKLGQWYRAKTLLAVVGDDFYFSRDDDWTDNIKSYGALFKEINTNPKKYGMQIQFGTLAEYFAELGKPTDYPTLSGDFFPYADAPSVYPDWTGYFATRPYYKRLERIIQSRLRSTDLLSALSLRDNDWHKITKPRRDLALFQHHDAITGTSTALVMKDYLDRLLAGLATMINTQAALASSILSKRGGSQLLTLTEKVPNGPELLSPTPLTIEQNGRIAIVVYNQLARQYTRAVRVVVRVPTVKVVRKNDGVAIPAQINPVIVGGTLVADVYELVFLADLQPLSLTTFVLESSQQQPESTSIADIAISGDPKREDTQNYTHSSFNLKPLPLQPIVFQNDYMTVGFSNSTGCVQFVKSAERQKKTSLEMSYWTYGDDGGTYTFKPTVQAKLLQSNAATIAVIRGPIVSEVHSALSPLLSQTIAVFKAVGALGQGVHITLRPNMVSVKGTTLVTRIKTEANFGHTFYTDTNGLFLMEHTYNSSKPIEANYNPVGSAVVLQNQDTRVTLLSGQPTGAVSETAGVLEAMVDRTISNDDGKGLGAGEATESPPSELKYTLLVEPRNAPAREDSSIAYHSLIVHQALEQLLHPPIVFLANSTADLTASLSLAPALPCDIELLNVRPLSDGSLLLLLRRLTFDCAAMGKGAQCANSQDSMQALIDALNVKSIEETTLTGTTTVRQLTSGAEILAQLGPMDLRAYRLRR